MVCLHLSGVPNSGGDLEWFVVICVRLRWFSDGLRWFVF